MKFVASDTDYATWVEFKALENVKDFKVLAINWEGEADDGKPMAMSVSQSGMDGSLVFDRVTISD